jgi:DNA-directed RNA polymerase subunit K/omega
VPVARLIVGDRARQIDSGDPARFDDLVNQSLPIIQSFKFQ